MAKTSTLLICAGTSIVIGLCTNIAYAADDEWEDWGDDDWSKQEQTKEPLIPINGYIESTLSYRTQNSDTIAEEWIAQDLYPEPRNHCQL